MVILWTSLALQTQALIKHSFVNDEKRFRQTAQYIIDRQYDGDQQMALVAATEKDLAFRLGLFSFLTVLY